MFRYMNYYIIKLVREAGESCTGETCRPSQIMYFSLELFFDTRCGKFDLNKTNSFYNIVRYQTCIIQNFLIRRVESSILSTRFLPSVWEIELPTRSVEK